VVPTLFLSPISFLRFRCLGLFLPPFFPGAAGHSNLASFLRLSFCHTVWRVYGTPLGGHFPLFFSPQMFPPVGPFPNTLIPPCAADVFFFLPRIASQTSFFKGDPRLFSGFRRGPFFFPGKLLTYKGGGLVLPLGGNRDLHSGTREVNLAPPLSVWANARRPLPPPLLFFFFLGAKLSTFPTVGPPGPGPFFFFVVQTLPDILIFSHLVCNNALRCFVFLLRGWLLKLEIFFFFIFFSNFAGPLPWVARGWPPRPFPRRFR